ncbi:MAG: hypothetical protein ACLQVI_25410 [Polyangiaceae bacterium]
MKALAVALLGLGLAGCAPATRAVPPRAPAPVSQWQDGTEEAASTDAVDESSDAVSDEGALPTATEVVREATEQEADAPAGELLEPAVVHRARIAMARAALVEDNLNKERVDLAEELQRELAALQENAETSKSRVKHGAPTKKQP